MQKKIIILDRDGVINYDSEHYIKTPDEWIPIPSSIKAIAKLSDAGFFVVVATNQSGVNRGYYSLDVLNQIHEKMHQLVREAGGKIDAVYFCPHRPDENCECRKPKPGMLLDIQKDYAVDMKEMIFVGDSLRDIQAGKMVGCRTALVKTGNGLRTFQKNEGLENVWVFEDLFEASENIIKSI